MASNQDDRRISDAQLDAAVEGARDMVESKRSALTENQDPVAQRGGGGAFQGASGSAQGGSNSPAGIDHPTDPAAETGGPRGAGTSISRTSGGRIDDGDEPRGLRAGGVLKREKGAFQAGTRGPAHSQLPGTPP